ncbi:hypothetical protein NLI96_g12556 [Meripilus lineatus]|uniref:Uncharacterized protein n=1 Tax=Meripilus lineatus TaxID=2056292 RepID=A0AAD5UPM3_9APHY|nr:hypothetical protein NLI96_g12556 [Physisporinus lineatus]
MSILKSKSNNSLPEEDPEESSSFSLERPEELRKPSFSFTFFDARRTSHIQSSLPSNKPRIHTRSHSRRPSTRPTQTSRRVCAVPQTFTSIQSDFTQKQNDYFGLFRRMHCWKLARFPWMWGRVKAFDDRLVGRISGMGGRRVRSVMDLIGWNGRLNVCMENRPASHRRLTFDGDFVMTG